MQNGFFFALISMAVFTAVAIVGILLLLDKDSKKDLSTDATDQFHFSDVFAVLIKYLNRLWHGSVLVAPFLAFRLF